MKEELILRSPEETEKLAEEMGRNARAGSCYALTGDLGCGKTLFTKAFARGMGIPEEITSPTFTLLEEYEGTPPLYHFDLYRIADPDELDMLFFEEYWEGRGVSVIEWAERAGNRLPDSTIRIFFTYI
ncbi:MAG: tRNA (adenosine(37)-N6)-threonylcarbamoyltransferase complex ATPase subunit type 1 TsaE, partial [Spirochaetota bacterium]